MGMSSQRGGDSIGLPPVPQTTGQRVGMGIAGGLNGAAHALDPSIPQMQMPQRPQFEKPQLTGDPRGYGDQIRQYVDSWRDQMGQYRQDRRDWRQDHRGQQMGNDHMGGGQYQAPTMQPMGQPDYGRMLMGAIPNFNFGGR